MKRDYVAPALTKLGTLEQLTEQFFNKVGSNADQYTAATNNQVVGSVVALP